MIQNIAEHLTHRFFIDNFCPELIHANVIPNNLDNRFQSFAFESVLNARLYQFIRNKSSHLVDSEA